MTTKLEQMKGMMGYIQASAGKRADEAAVPPAVPAGVSVEQYACRAQLRNAALIPLDKLVPDPNQPRKIFGEEELDQLAHSLATKGQLQPIRVRWSEEHKAFVILMGERRFRAAQRAGLSELECVVHDRPLGDDEILELQLIENCIRQDLNPIEQAEAFQNLLAKKGCSLSHLADELRMNKSSISRALSLLKLPEDIQRDIASGKIPPSVGREVAKLADEAAQREFIERFLAEGLTRDDTAAAVRQSQGKTGSVEAAGTKKTITVPGGFKIAVTHRQKHPNVAIAQALRQAAEILESDGRTKRKAG